MHGRTRTRTEGVVSADAARRSVPAAVAVVAAALGLAAWLVLDTRLSTPPEINGYVLATPRELPGVALVDEHGAQIRPENLRGHWSLLYFGYTYCPDVCPLTLVALASFKRELETQGVALPVEYYLVSVDPKRDTPERLREYVAYFDPELHGLTGSPQELAKLATATDAVFDVPDAQDGDNYLVSHSSSVVVLDPAARVRAVLAPPHEPSRMVADFTAVAAYGTASH